jgi:adenylate cyclase
VALGSLCDEEWARRGVLILNMFGLRSRSKDGAPKRYCVLFADVVSSTELYERLGDNVAKELVDLALKCVSDSVHEHGGHVVKNLGDGLLAYFESPSALEACLSIQDRALPKDVQLRMGLHHGPLLLETDDIFGDTVNTASRLADKARAGELLVSHAAFEAANAELRKKLRPLPPIRVKGKRAPVEIHSSFPNDQSETDVPLTLAGTPARSTEAPHLEGLVLEFGETELRVEPGTVVTIGRSPDCDVVIEHNETSRQHALLRFQSGTFVIEDTSTNGTYIVPDVGPA